MTLRPNYGRMPGLLKSAPYIDFEDFRREMTEYATIAMTAYKPTMSHGAHCEISEFISGQGHTLPDAYMFSARMREYLWGEKCGHEPEQMHDSACDEFYYYFFVHDDSL